MRAATYTWYGPPEVVQVMEVDKPLPKDQEVLVKVYASTVNRTDCGFRSAQYVISRFWSGLRKPRFHILGCEFAGQIEAIGKQVTAFKVGDRVFGFNDKTFGGHAEYLVIGEQEALATMPDHLPYQEAAPITEGAHYALCTIRAAQVAKGQQVLVYGATGANGSAAVQLLKYFGATVTAVCATKQVPLVKSLGADRVIDYTQEDFTQSEQRFDFVLDAVGKSSFTACKSLLTQKGSYISTELGKNAENIFLALFTPLAGGKKVLFPLPTISKQDVVLLRALVETKHFKPVIDRFYPLEHVVQAYHYVETGQKIGNVVLTLSDSL